MLIIICRTACDFSYKLAARAVFQVGITPAKNVACDFRSAKPTKLHPPPRPSFANHRIVVEAPKPRHGKPARLSHKLGLVRFLQMGIESYARYSSCGRTLVTCCNGSWLQRMNRRLVHTVKCESSLRHPVACPVALERSSKENYDTTSSKKIARNAIQYQSPSAESAARQEGLRNTCRS